MGLLERLGCQCWGRQAMAAFPPCVPLGSCRIRSGAGNGATPGHVDPVAVPMETAGSRCTGRKKEGERIRGGSLSSRTCSSSPLPPCPDKVDLRPTQKLRHSCGPVWANLRVAPQGSPGHVPGFATAVPWVTWWQPPGPTQFARHLAAATHSPLLQEVASASSSGKWGQGRHPIAANSLFPVATLSGNMRS